MVVPQAVQRRAVSSSKTAQDLSKTPPVHDKVLDPRADGIPNPAGWGIQRVVQIEEDHPPIDQNGSSLDHTRIELAGGGRRRP
jgi:hypothetical protein